MSLQMETEYFKNGEKIELSPEDKLKGYMIGLTPIPYDETLGMKKPNTTKGLRCLAFTKSSTIPPQLLCGNGTYLVMAKEGDGRSQKLFRLLVEAMIRLGHSMIASKVYMNGHKPKLVALTPNNSTAFPTLNMYEMVFADQVHHWYFPQLCTKKTQPSPEQYAAVEELIDSMDLMDAGEGGGEAFPHNKLVSPVVQNIYETVTKRALDPKYKVEVFDHRLLEALKMPQVVLDRSVEPIKKIKELFTLEAPKTYKKELVRKLCLIPVESDADPQAFAQYELPEETKKVLEIGTVTPEEDFKALVNEDITAFPKVSEQLANVLYDLIFKTMTDQSEKVCDTMTTFREFAKFYGPYVYTDWIRNVKTTVVTRRKVDFWENVVVRNRLGIISASESEQVVSVTDEEAEEFYRVNIGASASGAGQDDEVDVDDLFGQM